MKVKASDLTKSQLRYFRKEEEWYQEAILEALSRKPFKKVFKGKRMDGYRQLYLPGRKPWV